MRHEHLLINQTDGAIRGIRPLTDAEARDINLELERDGDPHRWESQEVRKCVPLPPFSEVLRRVLAVAP